MQKGESHSDFKFGTFIGRFSSDFKQGSERVNSKFQKPVCK